MSAPLQLVVENNVATITLCQPSKLNALDTDGYGLLGSTLRKVAEMNEVAVTIITGTGRYFSAGADVKSTIHAHDNQASEENRRFWFHRFASNNMDVAQAFYRHPKILIAALNGPAIGLSAALIACCDFIYATPDTFILTPFTSLGLVAEGVSSFMFVKRMGIAKANEALITSRRIPADELLSCGFVNRIFERELFDQRVKDHVAETFGQHLNHDSMLKVKALIKEGMERELEVVNIREAAAGVERFVTGAPQNEFMRIASGQKRHKL